MVPPRQAGQGDGDADHARESRPVLPAQHEAINGDAVAYYFLTGEVDITTVGRDNRKVVHQILVEKVIKNLGGQEVLDSHQDSKDG
ncbi:MAG: hypothetical protein JXA42_08640 [Anaerolineales bacterium]|nr:hypothetical protein [Anaerolineales bacterium]